MVHEEFLKRELGTINQSFDRNTKVVCEEFELVYPTEVRKQQNRFEESRIHYVE